MDIKEQQSANAGASRHPWELAKFKVLQYFLSQLKTETELNHITLVDIGCGDLFILKQLHERYPLMNLFGVDTAFNEEAMKNNLSPEQSSRMIIESSLDGLQPVITQPADFVLLLDVLEHIENDVVFLRNLMKCEFISPETQFIITAPAFQSLFCSHDEFLGHYRRYASTNLTKVVEATGLQTVDRGYFFFSLLLPRIVQKVYELMQHNVSLHQQGVGHWSQGKFITSIIKNALYLDFYLSRIITKITTFNIPGLSTFVICKKQPVL
ncbi:MAG TPA: methyltransferase domain-containing protein [Bacteroidota bacterium]|nr:methyltransferase domain-containing protein [Bacteroidota bacterium]